MTARNAPSFHLTIQAQLGATYVPYLRKYLRKGRLLLNDLTRSSSAIPPLTELSISLVNDNRMSELHQTFMNIPGPTDVLTFPIDLDSSGLAISGDVAICVPEARRQAREMGVPLRDELLLYALHGMLHLCGFDDRTKLDFDRMHRTEDDILGQLGIGHGFHRRAKTKPAGDR